MIGKQVLHYPDLLGIPFRRDKRLNRTVALKFLPRDLTGDTEARKRFMHESKAAASLQSPPGHSPPKNLLDFHLQNYLL